MWDDMKHEEKLEFVYECIDDFYELTRIRRVLGHYHIGASHARDLMHFLVDKKSPEMIPKPVFTHSKKSLDIGFWLEWNDTHLVFVMDDDTETVKLVTISPGNTFERISFMTRKEYKKYLETGIDPAQSWHSQSVRDKVKKEMLEEMRE